MEMRLLSGLASERHQSDTAATFEEARADFEAAWLVFLSNCTEADFQAWRDDRDWTERKYALWDAGKRLEPPNGTAREQAMKKIPRIHGSRKRRHLGPGT
jgi:hypothetical protein